MNVYRWFIAALILADLLTLRAEAIGPRSVTSGGLAVKWSSMPVTVHLETDLDVRGKDVSTLVDEALSAWVDLTESDVTITKGTLDAAVDVDNVCCYLNDPGACPSGSTDDGLNPLVIDEDGSITADFFGSGNQFTTLGFAAITSSSASTGAAVKGVAVFNASCLSGIEEGGCTSLGLSFSDDDFTSFIVHELGHFLGLDHSQVNLTEATDDDSSNDGLITTMFPIFVVGNGANFKTPDRDDQVGLAQLYPASSFSSDTWTITGTVFKADGATGLQCANVIARNQSSARVDAVSALTGDFATAGTDDGTYTIPGLTAGATYTVEIEEIPDNSENSFTEASGYTPCRGGSSGESGPPQFDAQTSGTTYSKSAGQTQSDVNFTVAGLESLVANVSPVREPPAQVRAEELTEIEEAIAGLEARSKRQSSCASSGGGGSGGSTTSHLTGGSCNLIPERQ